MWNYGSCTEAALSLIRVEQSAAHARYKAGWTASIPGGPLRQRGQWYVFLQTKRVYECTKVQFHL
jgi:hypothetical protein